MHPTEQLLMMFKAEEKSMFKAEEKPMSKAEAKRLVKPPAPYVRKKVSSAEVSEMRPGIFTATRPTLGKTGCNLSGIPVENVGTMFTLNRRPLTSGSPIPKAGHMRAYLNARDLKESTLSFQL